MAQPRFDIEGEELMAYKTQLPNQGCPSNDH